MLDVVLRNLAFRYDGGFAIDGVTTAFARSTHTAIAGPPACGASTLLRLIAGHLRPSSGDVVLGQRRVNEVRASRRPLLYVTAAIDVPGRWSVQHALVAAVRARSLDRHDRHREFAHAAEEWHLEPLLARRIDSLSSTERVRVHCARIELLRPAILLADRILEPVSAAARASMADRLYRALRIVGTTVISAPASRDELALTDAIVVMSRGRIIQSGSAAEVFARPADDDAAIAVGEVDAIPIAIRGNVVESVIGAWDVADPPFQGNGVALVRPSHFTLPAAGEESELVFGIEEAGFADGRWIAHGVLSGGITLRVELPRDAAVHKGRLIALRYDPAHFRLLPRDFVPRQTSVPTDVVPPLRDTR